MSAKKSEALTGHIYVREVCPNDDDCAFRKPLDFCNYCISISVGVDYSIYLVPATLRKTNINYNLAK